MPDVINGWGCEQITRYALDKRRGSYRIITDFLCKSEPYDQLSSMSVRECVQDIIALRKHCELCMEYDGITKLLGVVECDIASSSSWTAQDLDNLEPDLDRWETMMKPLSSRLDRCWFKRNPITRWKTIRPVCTLESHGRTDELTVTCHSSD